MSALILVILIVLSLQAVVNSRNYDNCWAEISSDINDGDAAVGASVSLTSNTDNHLTLAAGGYGHVQVFTYNSNSTVTANNTVINTTITATNDTVTNEEWMSFGNRINGEVAHDGTGSTVALSNDGTVMAVGAPYHTINSTHTSAGLVILYEYSAVSKKWQTKGNSILGQYKNERFGHSVSINNNGTIVVIGTHFELTTDRTYTRIYQYNPLSQKWQAMGSAIRGVTLGDVMGSATSISNSGYIVAIGAPYQNAGLVQVHYYNTTMKDWKQLGSTLYGRNDGDLFGGSLSLSLHGTMIAIGGRRHAGIGGPQSGHVVVYNYTATNKTWNQMGSDLYGKQKSDYSGNVVSLSADGRHTVVAIGAWGNDDGGPQSGHIRLFRYSDTEQVWNQWGQDLIGETSGALYGSTLSLSSSSSSSFDTNQYYVAVGGRSNGSMAMGTVKVYYQTYESCIITKAPSPSPSVLPTTSSTESPLSLTVRTNNNNNNSDKNNTSKNCNAATSTITIGLLLLFLTVSSSVILLP